jgi:hypothetical protein
MKIYVKTPCGEKLRAAASNLLYKEAIQEVGANIGRLHVLHGFYFLLDRFDASLFLFLTLALSNGQEQNSVSTISKLG